MTKDKYGEMKDRFIPSPIEDSPLDRWSKAQTERERRGEDVSLFTPQTFGAPPAAKARGMIASFLDIFRG